MRAAPRRVPRMTDTFFFANSGAEAVENAVKLARHATGKNNVIVFHGSYHGRSIGTMAWTTSKTIYRERFGPLPSGVFVAPFPYARQCAARERLHALSPQMLSDYCIEALEMLLHQQTAPAETACAIIEPVLGEGGYVVPPADFLRRLHQLCAANNILLIFDEVQTGFGRTGRMLALEHFGVVPDILVLAKGLASGYPLSAVISRRALMDTQPKGSMGGTYTGNAVACAAAIATLDVFEQDRLLENAVARGEQLRAGLCSMLGSGSPHTVRGLGLMNAVEFDERVVPGGTAARYVCGPWRCSGSDRSPDARDPEASCKRVATAGC